MRVVFLGSPPFATPILRRLLGSDYPPELVVTPPPRRRGRGRVSAPSEVAQLAAARGVPVMQPDSVRTGEVLEELGRLGADVFLVASYGEFLPRAFLELPSRECLNVHPSLLPRHRGATPVQAAILAGDERTGVSIQRVVLKLDAGDVVAVRETDVGPDETAGELSARLAELGADAALEALAAIDGGTAVFRPQDESQVTECRKLTKNDGLVDWSLPAAVLARQVRAFNPWPTARTTEPSGRELALLRARPADVGPEGAETAPGTILVAEGSLVVAAGEGALDVLELKPAGKRALAAADYLRGARVGPGERLRPGQRSGPGQRSDP